MFVVMLLALPNIVRVYCSWYRFRGALQRLLPLAATVATPRWPSSLSRYGSECWPTRAASAAAERHTQADTHAGKHGRARTHTRADTDTHEGHTQADTHTRADTGTPADTHAGKHGHTHGSGGHTDGRTHSRRRRRQNTALADYTGPDLSHFCLTRISTQH